MRLRSLFLLTLLAFTLINLGAFAQSKRPITEKDLFQFNWIGDPQVSPDGSRVAFVKVTVNKKHDGYETALYTVSTKSAGANGTAGNGIEQPIRLTSGTHDSSPRWSPDGSRIAFVRAVEKEGKPQPPQLYVLSMQGGEAVALTDLPKGAGGPKWSPDGRRIAFTSSTSPEDQAKKQRRQQRGCPELPASAGQAQGGNEAAPSMPAQSSTSPTSQPGAAQAAGSQKNEDCDADEADRESDVKTITRAVYRQNGEGYLDPKHPTHIWIIDAPLGMDEKQRARQLTFGKWDDDEFVWSQDSKQIYFTKSHLDEFYYERPKSDLFAVSADGGEPKLLNALNLDVGNMALSPDGKRLAFVAGVNEPVRSYTQDDVWTLELTANAQPKNLTTGFDWDVASGVGGDNAPPRAGGPSPLIWSKDGNSIITTVDRTGTTNIYRFDATTGAPTDITRGNQAVQRVRTSDGGQNIVALVSTPVNIGDLFLYSGTGEPRRLTNINEKLWSQLNLTAPEEINYKTFDGRNIQAWVQRPPDFQEGKKYPLILNIHGGPHSAYGWIFDHEFQWMAAKGYLVLYPNPRGSTSYGQEFGNIIQYKYPGDDYRDLMAGVDEVVRRGWADPNKLAVTGGSGGGVLTDWTVTHTDRFKAAVSQRDISNWASWWYTADFTLFQPQWFKAPPFQDPQDYANRSSITFVEKIRTPIAFILGDADWRTPPGSGGEQLFRALKFLKRPTAMVRFPGESHELSRSGQPWHRIERLQAIVGWMDKYVLGKDVPQFADVMQQAQPMPAATKPPNATPEKPR